jgi:cell volume regulation protein A
MRLNTELLELHIPPGSRLHGLEVFELRLPPGAAVSLLVRDGTTLVPTAYTQLRHEDDVLIVTPYDRLEDTESRLRTLARHGRLGGWYDARSEEPA